MKIRGFAIHSNIMTTMKINDIAHLCGYFSTSRTDLFKTIASDSFWTPVTYTAEDAEIGKRFYFQEFVDLCMYEVKAFTHVCSQAINVPMRDGSVRHAVLTDLRLYLYPFGMVMYSIGVRQDDVMLQDALQVLSALRMTFSVTGDTDFEKYAIKPLMDMCKVAGAVKLMESGNKFKLFQVVVSDGEAVQKEEMDRLLFSAGTLTMYDETDGMSFTKDYFEGIMSQGRLSVFRNWGALSLLDTFTIYAFCPKEYMLDVWREDYFSKLYLYNLFRKFFLFRLNHRFRADASRISHLKDELETFDRSYSFPILSYNFLPELVVKSMEKGLDIEDEKEKITVMVNQEKDRKEAATGDRMNLFLGVISCLTLFSAIWDFACLMDGMFVFGDTIGTVTGFRACTMLILAIMCMIILMTRWARK